MGLYLELTAVVLSAKCGKFIRKELQLESTHETFWTDSKVVLGYIHNNTKRFTIFVAKNPSNTRKLPSGTTEIYVPSKFNPADHASCGLGIADAEARISTWIHESKVFMAKGKHLAQERQL